MRSRCVVGEHPEQKQPITAQLGRYGPYISSGKDSRSLEKEEDVFSVTLEQALVLFAQPKTRGNQRKASEPIKEIGVDEYSGGVITLREGRFGLYVTDGETNASLRKDDSPESIDNARAQELLHQRRERAPVKKKRAKKKAVVSEKAAAAGGKKKAGKAKAAAADGASPEANGDGAPHSRASVAPAKKAAAKKAPKKAAQKKAGKAKSSSKKSTKPSARGAEPAIDSAE
jgi:DNA topoisomerase-1